MGRINLYRFFRKGIAASLAVCLILSSSSLTEAVAVDPYRPLHLQLAPPSRLGFVTDHYMAEAATRGRGDAEKRPLIILIQDLHAHYGVQKNIAGILEHLNTKLQTAVDGNSGKREQRSTREAVSGSSHEGNLSPTLSLTDAPVDRLSFAIGVEGGAGPIDQSLLATFPDQKIKAAASDYLMRQGELTGAEYYAVMQGLPRALVGVEEENYYNVHRMLFRKTFKDRDRLIKLLSLMRSDLQSVKERVFSRDLKRFERKLDLFERHKISYAELLAVLEKEAAAIGMDISGLRQSKSGDLLENAAAVAHLIKAQKAKTPQERDVIQVEHDLLLLIKVADLRATEKEVRTFGPRLNQFVALAQALLSGGKREQRSTREAARGSSHKGHLSPTLPLTDFPVDRLTSGMSLDLRELISSSIDYYALAMMRNQPMVDNTLALLNIGEAVDRNNGRPEQRSTRTAARGSSHEDSTPRRSGQPPHGSTASLVNRPSVAVLVAGGFHTAPITQLLRERGVNYLVITPMIDQLMEADHELYVKRLNGDLLTPEQVLAHAQAFKNRTSYLARLGSHHAGKNALHPGVPISSKLVIAMTLLMVFAAGATVEASTLTDFVQKFQGSWPGFDGVRPYFEQLQAMSPAFAAAPLVPSTRAFAKNRDQVVRSYGEIRQLFNRRISDLTALLEPLQQGVPINIEAAQAITYKIAGTLHRPRDPVIRFTAEADREFVALDLPKVIRRKAGRKKAIEALQTAIARYEADLKAIKAIASEGSVVEPIREPTPPHQALARSILDDLPLGRRYSLLTLLNTAEDPESAQYLKGRPYDMQLAFVLDWRADGTLATKLPRLDRKALEDLLPATVKTDTGTMDPKKILSIAVIAAIGFTLLSLVTADPVEVATLVNLEVKQAGAGLASGLALGAFFLNKPFGFMPVVKGDGERKEIEDAIALTREHGEKAKIWVAANSDFRFPPRALENNIAHVEGVVELVRVASEAFNRTHPRDHRITKQELRWMRLAASLHDIGKWELDLELQKALHSSTTYDRESPEWARIQSIIARHETYTDEMARAAVSIPEVHHILEFMRTGRLPQGASERIAVLGGIALGADIYHATQDPTREYVWKAWSRGRHMSGAEISGEFQKKLHQDDPHGLAALFEDLQESSGDFQRAVQRTIPIRAAMVFEQELTRLRQTIGDRTRLSRAREALRQDIVDRFKLEETRVSSPDDWPRELRPPAGVKAPVISTEPWFPLPSGQTAFAAARAAALMLMLFALPSHPGAQTLEDLSNKHRYLHSLQMNHVEGSMESAEKTSKELQKTLYEIGQLGTLEAQNALIQLFLATRGYSAGTQMWVNSLTDTLPQEPGLREDGYKDLLWSLMAMLNGGETDTNVVMLLAELVKVRHLSLVAIGDNPDVAYALADRFFTHLEGQITASKRGESVFFGGIEDLVSAITMLRGILLEREMPSFDIEKYAYKLVPYLKDSHAATRGYARSAIKELAPYLSSDFLQALVAQKDLDQETRAHAKEALDGREPGAMEPRAPEQMQFDLKKEMRRINPDTGGEEVIQEAVPPASRLPGGPPGARDETALTHPDTYLAGAIRLRAGRIAFGLWWLARSLGLKSAEDRYYRAAGLNPRLPLAQVRDQLTPEETAWIRQEFSDFYEHNRLMGPNAIDFVTREHPITDDDIARFREGHPLLSGAPDDRVKKIITATRLQGALDIRASGAKGRTWGQTVGFVFSLASTLVPLGLVIGSGANIPFGWETILVAAVAAIGGSTWFGRVVGARLATQTVHRRYNIDPFHAGAELTMGTGSSAMSRYDIVEIEGQQYLLANLLEEAGLGRIDFSGLVEMVGQIPNDPSTAHQWQRLAPKIEALALSLSERDESVFELITSGLAHAARFRPWHDRLLRRNNASAALVRIATSDLSDWAAAKLFASLGSARAPGDPPSELTQVMDRRLKLALDAVQADDPISAATYLRHLEVLNLALHHEAYRETLLAQIHGSFEAWQRLYLRFSSESENLQEERLHAGIMNLIVSPAYATPRVVLSAVQERHPTRFKTTLANLLRLYRAATDLDRRAHVAQQIDTLCQDLRTSLEYPDFEALVNVMAEMSPGISAQQKLFVLGHLNNPKQPSERDLEILRRFRGERVEPFAFLLLDVWSQAHPETLSTVVARSDFPARMRIYAFGRSAVLEGADVRFPDGLRQVASDLMREIAQMSEGGSFTSGLLGSPFSSQEIAVYSVAAMLDAHGNSSPGLPPSDSDLLDYIRYVMTATSVRAHSGRIHSGFEFGTRMMQQLGGREFVMVVYHELMHNMLTGALRLAASDSLDTASIHEFLADWNVIWNARRLGWSTASYGRLVVSRYKSDIDPNSQAAWAEEEHEAGRKQILLMIQALDEARGKDPEAITHFFATGLKLLAPDVSERNSYFRANFYSWMQAALAEYAIQHLGRDRESLHPYLYAKEPTELLAVRLVTLREVRHILGLDPTPPSGAQTPPDAGPSIIGRIIPVVLAAIMGGMLAALFVVAIGATGSTAAASSFASVPTHVSTAGDWFGSLLALIGGMRMMAPIDDPGQPPAPPSDIQQLFISLNQALQQSRFDDATTFLMLLSIQRAPMSAEQEAALAMLPGQLLERAASQGKEQEIIGALASLWDGGVPAIQREVFHFLTGVVQNIGTSYRVNFKLPSAITPKTFNAIQAGLAAVRDPIMQKLLAKSMRTLPVDFGSMEKDKSFENGHSGLTISRQKKLAALRRTVATRHIVTPFVLAVGRDGEPVFPNADLQEVQALYPQADAKAVLEMVSWSAVGKAAEHGITSRPREKILQILRRNLLRVRDERGDHVYYYDDAHGRWHRRPSSSLGTKQFIMALALGWTSFIVPMDGPAMVREDPAPADAVSFRKKLYLATDQVSFSVRGATVEITPSNDPISLIFEGREGLEITLGHHVDSDVWLKSRWVSNKHAVLKFTAGRWHFKDNGSTVGTRDESGNPVTELILGLESDAELITATDDLARKLLKMKPPLTVVQLQAWIDAYEKQALTGASGSLNKVGDNVIQQWLQHGLRPATREMFRTDRPRVYRAMIESLYLTSAPTQPIQSPRASSPPVAPLGPVAFGLALYPTLGVGVLIAGVVLWAVMAKANFLPQWNMRRHLAWAAVGGFVGLIALWLYLTGTMTPAIGEVTGLSPWAAAAPFAVPLRKRFTDLGVSINQTTPARRPLWRERKTKVFEVGETRARLLRKIEKFAGLAATPIRLFVVPSMELSGEFPKKGIHGPAYVFDSLALHTNFVGRDARATEEFLDYLLDFSMTHIVERGLGTRSKPALPVALFVVDPAKKMELLPKGEFLPEDSVTLLPQEESVQKIKAVRPWLFGELDGRELDEMRYSLAESLLDKLLQVAEQEVAPRLALVPLASTPKPTVMLVDDEQHLLEPITTILRHQGYSVETFENGQSALHYYASHTGQDNVLVTDTNMAGMRGPELIKEMRTINSRLPVISMSGEHAEERDAALAALGLEGVVTLNKPFQAQSLMSAIDTVVASARQGPGHSGSLTLLELVQHVKGWEAVVIVVGVLFNKMRLPLIRDRLAREFQEEKAEVKIVALEEAGIDVHVDRLPDSLTHYGESDKVDHIWINMLVPRAFGLRRKVWAHEIFHTQFPEKSELEAILWTDRLASKRATRLTDTPQAISDAARAEKAAAGQSPLKGFRSIVANMVSNKDVIKDPIQARNLTEAARIHAEAFLRSA